MKSRVMYLDVDDTLLVWTNGERGIPAPKSVEFMRWAQEHFEVRWLTMWCPAGWLSPEGAIELSRRFDLRIPPEEFMQIVNPKGFVNSKTEGIDFNDLRPWVWVEDGILSIEKQTLDDRGMLNRFYKTNVSHNAVMLQSTWRKLARDFQLPGEPAYPYDTTIHLPPALYKEDMDAQAMIDKLTN